MLNYIVRLYLTNMCCIKTRSLYIDAGIHKWVYHMIKVAMNDFTYMLEYINGCII